MTNVQTLIEMWSRDGSVSDAVTRLFAIGAGNTARTIIAAVQINSVKV